jgi:uncharacterized protein HemY
MFNTNFATQLMEQSLSDEFLSQLVAGYLKIKEERFSEASDHFNKMLYSSHNPNDDDILWIAKAHIYRKIGKEEESKTCIDMVLGAFENPKILEYNLGR